MDGDNLENSVRHVVSFQHESQSHRFDARLIRHATNTNGCLQESLVAGLSGVRSIDALPRDIPSSLNATKMKWMGRELIASAK